MESGKKLLFDHHAVRDGIIRMATGILAEFPAEKLPEIAMIGIQTRGVIVAGRLQRELQRCVGCTPVPGSLDITMYRDDIGKRNALPIIHETDIPLDLDGKIVILVDDVLHTGRTIRAALDALTDYGRPAMIRLAALVDREGREFPIRADYAGLTAKLPAGRKMRIVFGEEPDQDAIYNIQKSNKKIVRI
ncbi:MAG: bifunctional pyr operon transcriptional regulator/uracil phosphoribosyltransferase PyrR [Victivallales bacterium]|nr:bifunctional pyr operon transcriptional regulator/uracil phosphoribosyltransferase PyrR [Victivallales bacterium]